MASAGLRHRPKHAPAATAKPGPSVGAPAARRGLRSLSIAVGLPLSLTLATAVLSPGWAFHAGSACASALAALAAWLVWADRGFRREPAALPLYLWQLAAGLAWAPLVLRAGAAKAGLAACAGAVVALAGCAEVFGRVNPAATALIRPCMAWALFLSFFTFRLL